MGNLLAITLLLSTQTHTSLGEKIVKHARAQVGVTLTYNPGYERIPYPMGDVPKSKGVCTDVVIRALRPLGYDLQALIHNDAKKSPSRYPRISSPDRNIDHRRCPNQMAFFARYGATLDFRSVSPERWKPGEIIFWKLPNGRDHVGIVSDQRNSLGVPLAIHNIGAGAKEEDCLIAWKVVGRFRFPK